MKNCNACGMGIGDDVSICIHCGTDQRSFFMRHKIITLFLVMLVIGIIDRATGATTPTGTTEVTQATSSQVNPKAPTKSTSITPEVSPIQITAKQLEQEYDDNQFAADEKYKGKLLEVVGIIITIDRDFSDNPYIKLAAEASGHSFTGVRCRFAKKDALSLAKVNKRHEVTVQGVCGGIDGDVKIINCEVMSISSEPIQVDSNKSLLYKYYENQN